MGIPFVYASLASASVILLGPPSILVSPVFYHLQTSQISYTAVTVPQTGQWTYSHPSIIIKMSFPVLFMLLNSYHYVVMSLVNSIDAISDSLNPIYGWLSVLIVISS